MVFETVEQLCKENNISIARLEKECGLGNATVKGWKNGSPRIDLLKRVADYFGVTVDYLISNN